jgi:hypothetical protein
MGNRTFTLRTSMAVIAALCFMLTWVRSQGSLGYALIVVSHSIVAWGFCLAMAIAIARVFGPAVRGRTGRVTVWSLLALITSASIYVAWGHYRTMYLDYFGLDHGFPYPDRAINALERWFDVRRPIAPGSLKLHGEYPLVGFVLGLFVLAFTSLAGLLLGVLLNQPQGVMGQTKTCD